jgi:hypothetical protein
MQKDMLEIEGLVDLSEAQLVQANGGFGFTSTQFSTFLTQVKPYLTGIVSSLSTLGVSATTIASLTALIAKIP